jgi:hypothetical protein
VFAAVLTLVQSSFFIKKQGECKNMVEKFSTRKFELFNELVAKLSADLCNDDIELVKWAKSELAKRDKMAVKEYDHNGYSLCPRCYRNIEFDYCGHCDRCGQGLRWQMSKMKYVSHEEIMKRVRQYKKEKQQFYKKKSIVTKEVAAVAEPLQEIIGKSTVFDVKNHVLVAVEEPVTVAAEVSANNYIEQITVNEVLDYLDTDKSTAANKAVASCFVTIMKTLAEQMQAR